MIITIIVIIIITVKIIIITITTTPRRRRSVSLAAQGDPLSEGFEWMMGRRRKKKTTCAQRMPSHAHAHARARNIRPVYFKRDSDHLNSGPSYYYHRVYRYRPCDTAILTCCQHADDGTRGPLRIRRNARTVFLHMTHLYARPPPPDEIVVRRTRFVRERRPTLVYGTQTPLSGREKPKSHGSRRRKR